MKYGFHPEAEEGFLEAVEYFEAHDEGLGLDFAHEIFSAIARVISFPYAWSPLEDQFRRCLVDRFPYGLIYEVFSDEIFILSVMHLNREPGYWRDRTTS